MLKIGSRVILVLALLMSGISGVCIPRTSTQLDVPLEGQETANWCWAASAVMVKNFVHRPDDPDLRVKQCDEATKANGGTNCCPPAGVSGCDKRRWPNFAAPDFSAEDTWGPSPPSPPPQPPLPPLPWATIKEEIGCAKRPFVYAWKNVNGSGHMIVVIGYGRDQGVRTVYINDPLPQNKGTFYGQSYDWYAGESPDAQRHWRDIYGIEYIGTGE